MALPDLQHRPLRNVSLPKRLRDHKIKERTHKEVKRSSDPWIHNRLQIRWLHKQLLHPRQADPDRALQRLLFPPALEASDPPERAQAAIFGCCFVPTVQHLRDARGEQLFRCLPQVAEYWGRSHSIIGDNIIIFQNPVGPLGIAYLGNYEVLLPLFYLASTKLDIKGFIVVRSILNSWKNCWRFGWLRLRTSRIRRTWMSSLLFWVIT